MSERRWRQRRRTILVTAWGLSLFGLVAPTARSADSWLSGDGVSSVERLAGTVQAALCGVISEIILPVGG
jgi:hypothetical protein